MLKCRPPGNRDPLPAEIAACEPYLYRQLELIRPSVVAPLGSFATALLSGRALGITRVHGQEQPVTLGGRTVTLYPLYHPAAALYTPTMLEVLERDVARLPELLGAQAPPAIRGTASFRRPGARRAGRAAVSPARPARALLTPDADARDRERLGGGDRAVGGAARARARPRRRRPPLGRARPGKTTFVRGASRALGVTARVTSPTFTIGHRYPGVVDVSHLDLYRFRGLSTAEWGDLEPYFDGAVVFVEWPEAGAEALPPARACVRLEHLGPESRRVIVAADEDALLQEVAGADPGVRHRD